MMRLTIVDARNWTLLFEQTYATDNEARRGAVAWFRRLVGDLTAESIFSKDGDAYDQIVRYCDGSDRIQVQIKEVSREEM